jgi:hypothetical protein
LQGSRTARKSRNKSIHAQAKRERACLLLFLTQQLGKHVHYRIRSDTAGSQRAYSAFGVAVHTYSAARTFVTFPSSP